MAVFFMIVVLCLGQGNNYYVSPAGSDANSGTQASPWRTIQHAASRLVAGDTAILMDGTYTEAMITFKNDGTAASPITIRAQNKWSAVLASTSGCMPAIYILKSYITIDGLRFSVSPNNAACGSPRGNSWNAALWGYNASQILPSPGNPRTPTSHCVVRNNYVEASGQRDVGFKWVQDYATFEHNVVYGSIEGFNNFGSKVHDNTVYNGDHWSSYMYFKGGVRSLEVYNNLVEMNAGQNGGITIGGSSGNGWFDASTHIEAYNSVAYNNVVVVQGGNSGNATPALGLMGAANSAIYNNVVIGGQIFSALGSAFGYDPRPPTNNPSFANNIVSCNGGVSTYSGMWSFTGSLNIRNNNFFNCNGAPSQSNAVTGNPNFVDARSDWHLYSGSAGTGTGAILSFTGYLGENIDVSVGKDGRRRAPPWDLGIYDSNSSVITSPPSGPAPDTTAPTVPGNVTAVAVSSSQINLSWAASTDNAGVAGYRIFRHGTLVATVGPVTSYQNTGLAAGSYAYSVAAFDLAGNVSIQSATVTATTLPGWAQEYR